MAWKIEFDPSAKRGLDKLDRQTATRVLKFLRGRITTLDNPRLIGEALQDSKLGNFWKYRVGDYRIIARIEDQEVTLMVVQIGNWREDYRR